MVYNFLDRKTESGTASKFRANINKVPAQELHNALIKRFKRRNVYARFEDNTLAVNLAEMRSISFFNGSVKYCV